ncbi:MAG: sugar transferase [Polyangiaceae bacterium]|jgi:lipopolysaccharide/colanic/teichoic acid biosynthesis glycosyltransferase/glycosyltransferase involved in cell wall biosynthesis
MRESVAIVHDWLTTMRGGERVLEVLCGVFPDAHLFTLTRDPAALSPALASRRTTMSPIDRVAKAPFVRGRFRALLPLFPLAVESFKLDPYALVVSSSHCVAMGAIAPPRALHVAYVHSTLRYVREAQCTYEASVPGGRVGRAVFRGTAHYLRRWETAAAARPHALIANSTYTRDRIRRYYDRDALVIEPPIETSRFERAAARAARPSPESPFLLVSALVPNKRVDLALRAFEGRSERLVVVGEGPERTRLGRLAGPNVTLLPRVDDAELDALCAGCQALLHTGVDDFGMVMVEALAAGRPVIACAEGGALEIVRDGETGLLIEEATVAGVRAALDRFARLGDRFDPAVLQAFAKRYDRENFERRFAAAVEDARRNRRNAGSNGVHGGSRSTMHPPGGSGAAEVPKPSGSNGVHGGSRSTMHPPGGSGAPEVPKPSGSNGVDSHSGATPESPRRAASALSTQGRGHPNEPSAHPTDTSTVEDCVAKHPPLARAVKRLVDIALASSGLVLTAPLLTALAALIPLDSPGPPLFRQERTGLGQRAFTLVKLRTMDTEKRVTRLGHLLRPLGLDELPQLWNVLKGDMSLIGPRPEVPSRVERYDEEFPGFRDRHLMRPGITGWAQVNGLRGDKSPIGERLRFDAQYIRTWSLALDVRIFMRTGSTVVRDAVRELRD